MEVSKDLYGQRGAKVSAQLPSRRKDRSPEGTAFDREHPKENSDKGISHAEFKSKNLPLFAKAKLEK